MPGVARKPRAGLEVLWVVQAWPFDLMLGAARDMRCLAGVR